MRRGHFKTGVYPTEFLDDMRNQTASIVDKKEDKNGESKKKK